MSVINYRRSVNGQNDSLGRKYLSDSLTPWWGTWYSGAWGVLGTPSIAYDSLPINDAIARIYYAASSGTYIAFSFYTPQNLSNYVWEFYIKCATNDPSVWIQIQDLPQFGGMRYYYGPMYADGTAPTSWTKKSFSISNLPPAIVWSIPGISKSAFLTRLRFFVIYFDNIAAPTVEINISGMTFRRQ